MRHIRQDTVCRTPICREIFYNVSHKFYLLENDDEIEKTFFNSINHCSCSEHRRVEIWADDIEKMDQA